MAVERPPAGDKAQQFALVHPHGLAGSQIICNQNDRLLLRQAAVPPSTEGICHLAGYILHIHGPRLHIGIVHGGKCRREIFSSFHNSVFCGSPPGFDNISDRLQIVLIVQHHLVDLKDGRSLPARLVQRFFIEPLQLAADCLPGGLKAVPLLRGSKSGSPADVNLCFFVDTQRTYGNTL